MKNNRNLTVFVVLAAVLGFFLYMFKNQKNKSVANVPANSGSADGENTVLTTNKQTRGIRNNNPFNIRYSAANNWEGQTGSDGAFCVFSSMPYGIRAGGVLLRKYLKNGANTIEKIISKFAPSSENNTKKYIADVAKMSGINADKVLTDGDLWRIARPMMLIESRYNATDKDKTYFNNPNFNKV